MRFPLKTDIFWCVGQKTEAFSNGHKSIRKRYQKWEHLKAHHIVRGDSQKRGLSKVMTLGDVIMSSTSFLSLPSKIQNKYNG